MHRIAKDRMFSLPGDASAQIHSLSTLCLEICWGSGTLLTTVSSARSNFPLFIEDLAGEIFKMSSPDRKWNHN
jgi:hypothetical protein